MTAKLETLSLAIHGKKHARREMAWAVQMKLAGTKGGIADPRLDAEWKARSMRNLQPVFEALCEAAAEHRPEPFFHLAECIAEMKSRGKNWAADCPQKIIAWTHANPGQPLGITQFRKDHGYSEKTVRKWAKELGVPTQKPGHPGVLGKNG